MRIPLDRQVDTPLYQQIADYLRQSILSGSLAPDTRLPATRQLAQDLGLNRITVQNAYAELEADGLIASRVGSGSYVLPPNPLSAISRAGSDTAWPLWQQEVLSRNEAIKRRRLDEVIKGDGAPWAERQASPIISFAEGGGDPNQFPVKDFRKVFQAVLRRDGQAALEYGDRCGYAPLRATIAHILARQGLQVQPDNLLITTGSQQALALVAQLLLKPEDGVLVETPTYSGALALFAALRLRVVGAPMDDQGVQVDRLEQLLQQHHPKLIYLIPNFQNPTGRCLSSQRRRHLLALADRYNIPILEDDFVGDLRYEGHAQPTLKALDPGGRVIYVSTFSKMLLPGLRVGFLAAEGPVYENLVSFKRVNDLATTNLGQRALEAYVTVGGYQAHLRRSCQVYGRRRDAMLSAIEKYLPAEVQVTPPQGGLFMWLRLPEGVSATALQPVAAQAGVTFAAGPAFYPEAGGDDYVRLNFAAQPPEAIEAGVRRLGNALDQARALAGSR